MKLAQKKVAWLIAATLLATTVMVATPVAVAPASAEMHAGTTFNFSHDDRGGWTRWGACLGTSERSIRKAKESFRDHCRQEWRYNSGAHYCDWSPKGWVCLYWQGKR